MHRKRIQRHQLRVPMEEDETDDEPVGAAAREEATVGRRVL